MTQTTSFMPITVWNQPIDNFSYEALLANWTTVASHDHTNGKGKQVPTGGIEDGAVSTAKLSSGVQAQLADSRSPTGAAGGILTGSYPDPGALAAPEAAHVVGAGGQPGFGTDWSALTSANSVRFWKGVDGRVYFAGLARRAASSNLTMFTLPADYRPSNTGGFQQFILIGEGSSTPPPRFLIIAQNGNVGLQYAPSDQSLNVYLDGISFDPRR